MRLGLALVLHAHQPVGNFDAVIEQAYQSSYLPFLAAADARPWLKLNLHYSGFLLEWLARQHPEYLIQLRGLQAAGRLELLGGGFYEPILAVIPPAHQQAQLERLSHALQRHFGARPHGAWLAERVWEPALPAVLAQAGLEYTLLDDSHFEAAGVASDQLHGYWMTEDGGKRLRVVPSNFFLRNALPFRPESEGLGYLQQARDHGVRLLTMGDDLEKFGSWPHTHQHVYTDGWLRRFLDGLEALAESVETVLLHHALARQPARGLIYLPTASYPEMMRWAGNSTWRGFLTRYREANLLHKSVWELARRVREPAAVDELLAAECNDAYWHGWFGGLYSPHLRNQVFSHLLAAEAGLPARRLRRYDLHGDGGEIIELRTAALRLRLDPSEGGTIQQLDALPLRASLINSLQRRPEAYHDEMRQQAARNPGNLPGGPAAPQLDWAARLRYDRYPNSFGRLYLCPPAKEFADFEQLRLEEDPAVAGDAYSVVRAQPGRVSLARNEICKNFVLEGGELALEAEFPPGPVAILEAVLNLLAPDAPDRWLEQAGVRRSLRWAGELPPLPLLLWDGWRQMKIQLTAPGARAWWVAPIETVSQSESGGEAIYQGSKFAAVWPPAVARCRLEFKMLP